MPDLTTPEGARDYMRGSASKDDWNARCLDVSRALDAAGDELTEDECRRVERTMRSNLYRQVATAKGWE